MKALGPRILAACLAACLGASAQAADILIRNATVHTLTAAAPLEHTDVRIHDKVIAAVGKNLESGGATVVDAGNHPLTPGLWGGLSAVGLIEIPVESDTVDAVEGAEAPPWNQQWRPEFDVTLAYNPRSTIVPITRIEGVTWTVLSPGSTDSIVGGQGAAVLLDGRFDAVLAGSRSLFIAMGGGNNKISSGSRAGQYMLLDQAIREARLPGGGGGEGRLLHAAGREALLRYLQGGRIVFSVDRASDIVELIAYVERNGLKAVIAGASEGWVVAKELARADIPVILDPLQNLPSGFDQLASRLDNPALLHRAGVRMAFAGGYPRSIRESAGVAVAAGLPWDVALASLTKTPAEMFGLASRGRIAVGQSADLVLWDGDPLEVTTIAERVWINGAAIAMRSRQTLLRDRYLERAKLH